MRVARCCSSISRPRSAACRSSSPRATRPRKHRRRRTAARDARQAPAAKIRAAVRARRPRRARRRRPARGDRRERAAARGRARALPATKGNPFFLEEVIRQLAEQGRLVAGGGWDALLHRDFDVPESVRFTIENRLEKLRPDTRRRADGDVAVRARLRLRAARSICRSCRRTTWSTRSTRPSGRVSSRRRSTDRRCVSRSRTT